MTGQIRPGHTAAATAWMTGRQPLAIPDTDAAFYARTAAELPDHVGDGDAVFNADLEDRIGWIVERLRKQFGAITDDTVQHIRLQAHELAQRMSIGSSEMAVPETDQPDQLPDRSNSG